MRILTVMFIGLAFATSAENPEETTDGDESRKILGSSVVTSVSVVMDNGNGSKTVYTDAVGKPMGRPSNGADLASPIDLLNPDRYEFYTFDDNGELIKRLMSLEEIKGIIATGDTDGLDFDAFTSQGYLPERRVNEVVNTVQNVLKEEIETHNKNTLDEQRPPYDTPDVSDSWSMILPAVFGNSGEDIKPDKPIAHVTPDTIMIEPNVQNALDANTTTTARSSYSTPRSTSSTPMSTAHPSRPTRRSTTQETSSGSEIVTKVPSLASSSPSKGVTAPTLDVEIFSNSKITTSAPTEVAFVEIKSPTRATTTKSTATTTKSTTTTTTPEPTTTEPTTTEPTTTTPGATTTAVKSPGTPTTFTSWTILPTIKGSGMPSTVPTTDAETTYTKIDRISTWRPDPEEKEEEYVSKLPTLAHILGYTKLKGDATATTTTPDAPTTFFTTTESPSSTIPPLSDKSEEDLSTLSSEYSGFKKPTATTTVPASTSLNQLLFSTDADEINNLSDTTPTEQRFETTTTIKPPDATTVQPFVITVGDNADKTLIGSIEQLLSQAVNDVEKVLVDANDTERIQAMLDGYNKTSNETQKDAAATFASNLMDKPSATTEPMVPASDDSLNESLESLISQISDTEPLVVETSTNSPGNEGSSGTTDVGTTGATESTTLNDGGVATTTDAANETIEQLRPKPAKADLSLETWYDDLNRTDFGNATTAATTTEEESIKTQETSNLPLATTHQYDTKEKPTTVVIIKRTERPTEPDVVTSTMTPEITTTTITTEKTIESSPNGTEPSKLPQVETITEPDGTTWTLVSTIAPHAEVPAVANVVSPLPEAVEPPVPIDLSGNPMQGFGLEDTTAHLEDDVFKFAQLCNELAFGFWRTIASGLSSARSVVVSPFGATSLLAMVFLGARGATSGEMNEILKLDDVVTFNPHLIFKNVSESVRADEPDSGVAVSAIVRELFADKSKGRLLPFYKERARAFYDGFVEEVGFKGIGDVVRRRTNLQVKKATGGRLAEFLRDSSIVARPPLAGVSVNIFHTDCSRASTEGRDGELYFVVLPSIRQRRLVPVPAVVYRRDFLAGYEPSLDATAVSVGHKDKTTSTIFVMPGQQGMTAPGDGLARLEKRLVESSFKKGAWSRLLRSLIPRLNLDVQIPRFSHKSVINASAALQKMGLRELFDVTKADLLGLNGVPNDLFLSDVIQVNNFATCGERSIDETHHSEIYPATGINARSARHLEQYLGEGSTFGFQQGPIDYQRAFHDPLHDPTSLNIPLSLRPRQARIPEVPRLRFDRPFMYFVRHNPTGLILHMGRFNPRLLP